MRITASRAWIPLAALALAATSSFAQRLPFLQERAARLFLKDAGRFKATFDSADPGKLSVMQGYLKRLEPHMKHIRTAPQDHPDIQQVTGLWNDFQAKTQQAANGGGAAAGGSADASGGSAGAGASAGAAAGTSGPDPAAVARELNPKVQAVYRDLKAMRGADYSDAGKVQAMRARLDAIQARAEAAGGSQDRQLGAVLQNVANFRKTLDSNAGISARNAANQAAAQRAASASAAAAAAARAQPAASAAPAAAPAALDYSAKRALNFFNKDHDRYQRNMSAGLEVDKRSQYEDYVTNLENRLAGVSARYHGHPDYLAAKAKIAAIQQRIASELGNSKPLSEAETAAIGEFRQEYNRVSYELDAWMDPIELQKPESRARAARVLAKLRAPLDRVANKEHPKYKEEWARLAPWIARLEAVEKQGASMAAQAGDVDGDLAAIQAQFPQGSFQPNIPRDASPDEVETLAKRYKGWIQGAEDAKAFFEKARSLSVKARSPEFRTYSGWFEREVPSDLRREKDAALRHWSNILQRAALNQTVDEARLAKATGDYGENMAAMIQEGIDAADRLLAWQRGFDGAEDPETRSTRASLQANYDKLGTVLVALTAKVRLWDPVVASPDPTLEAEAQRLLKKRFGDGVRRIRQHSKMTSHKNLEYYDGKWFVNDYDRFVATCATRRDSDGTWWVTTSSFRYYRRGWQRQTLNTWLYQGITRFRKILPENIDK